MQPEEGAQMLAYPVLTSIPAGSATWSGLEYIAGV